MNGLVVGDGYGLRGYWRNWSNPDRVGYGWCRALLGMGNIIAKLLRNPRGLINYQAYTLALSAFDIA